MGRLHEKHKIQYDIKHSCWRARSKGAHVGTISMGKSPDAYSGRIIIISWMDMYCPVNYCPKAQKPVSISILLKQKTVNTDLQSYQYVSWTSELFFKWLSTTVAIKLDTSANLRLVNIRSSKCLTNKSYKQFYDPDQLWDTLHKA